MNKKMRELLTKIEQKRLAAKGYMDGETKDMDKAKATLDEIEDLQKEFDIEKRLYEAEKADNGPTNQEMDDLQNNKGKNKDEDVIKEFAGAARKLFKVTKDFSEGTPADGGYTVPTDILTKINSLKEATFSMLKLVSVESVKTNTGARTYKTRSTQTGFSAVDEGGTIAKKATPTFARVAYAIKKYAGYFPVTNELLADSDANIVQVLTEWIAGESQATANNLILTKLATKTPTNLANLDGIKNALNKTLGAKFKGTATIVTNDDGLQYLDTLKDSTGRPLLSPNPANPMQLRLSAGATAIPIEVVPNEILATTDNKVPFLIGDFKEAITYFDRQQLSIKATDTASVTDLNAFEEDLTLFRAIEREDVQIKDAAAFVNGYITVA